MSWTLAAAAGATLVAGALFVRVGASLWSRAPESAHDRRAMRGFASWWLGIGLSTLAFAGLDIVALLPSPPLALAIAFRMAAVMLSALAIGGLLSHVLYLYTANERTALLASIYGILAIVAGALVVWSQPDGLAIDAWTADLRGTNPAARALVIPFYVAYLVPVVVAGGLYLGLLRRASDAGQRLRIATVGIGVSVWGATFLLARVSDADLWQLLTRVGIGVALAALVTHAYAPPRTPNERAEEDEAFTRRVRQLV